MGETKFLSTARLLDAFSQEIAEHGGSVTDVFNDGQRLLARSVLPRIEEIRAHDRLRGGVALKANDGEVCIHPYTFRLVCQNGAIMATAFASRVVTATFDWDREKAISDVRQAVQACCAPEVFTNCLQYIRSATDVRADLAIHLLPMLTRMQVTIQAAALQDILKRFFGDTDRTRFGLMNAVTSVARDTADPHTRWNLEELGGAIPTTAPPRFPARRAARQPQAELVS